MRTYTLDGIKFEGYELFEAALRDKEKIESIIKSRRFGFLDLEEDIDALSEEDAEVLYYYLERENIRFETELGRGFFDKIKTAARFNTDDGEASVKKFKTTRVRQPIRIPVVGIIKSLAVVAMLAMMCNFTFMFYQEVKGSKEAKERFYALRDQKLNIASVYADSTFSTGSILPEYVSLHSQNPDMVGWLSIDYTNVDYPVMYREDDNDYYLNKSFYQEPDSNGMLILDKRCNPNGDGENILIHGHNMKSGMMFGALRKYMDSGYLADHKFINYDTLYEKRKYVIVSVFITSLSQESSEGFRYYNYIDVDNEYDFNQYVAGIKASSLYETGETASFGDRLITLSTCDYSISDGRLVIVGREIKDE